MPALKETHAAAVRACVSLLEAFDVSHSALARRDALRTALECAMDATGMSKADRQDAGELIDAVESRKGRRK